MQILLISDIHANFPALLAIERFFCDRNFDYIINCGDSLVYAPFPNETLLWLRENKSISIRGNTDKKVIKLLKGKTFKKPKSHEKRIMYQWTAEHLNSVSIRYLQSLKNTASLTIPKLPERSSLSRQIGIYHGSPARNHEFLFEITPDSRFIQLSQMTSDSVVICGHSHIPFYKYLGKTHFINPGSVGRMFDGDPCGSCAVLQLDGIKVSVEHFRIPYDIEETIFALHKYQLPKVYQEMFRQGRKTN